MTTSSRPPWFMKRQTAHPIEPPPTPEELAWWKEARRPIRRREVARWGLMLGVPLAVTAAVKDGVTHVLSYVALGHVALGIGFVVFTGGLMWLGIGSVHMRMALTEKRMRAGLAREARREAITAPDETAGTDN